jgi:hypothetical protein
VSLPLFGVSSTDSILEITFRDNGGDPYWLVNGMDVAISGSLPSEAKERLEFGAALGALSASLTNEALAAAQQSALAIWSGAGLSAQQMRILSSTPIGLTDFGSQNVLGAAFTQIVPSIWIDNDAAGAGWHVDGSSSPAHGRADLLTVVLHEMGHILGLDHDVHAGALMASSLSAGTRLLPNSLPRLTAAGSTFAASVVPSLVPRAADFLTPSLSSPFNSLRVSSSQPFTARDQLFTRLGETDSLLTDSLTPRVDALDQPFGTADRTTDRRVSRAKRHHDDLFAAWDPSQAKIGGDVLELLDQAHDGESAD